MKFSHQNKRQVRDGVTVVAHPSLRFFLFDDFDELVRNLVEQGLGRRYVNDGKDDSAYICTGPTDVIHCFNAPNSFDDGGDLLFICFVDTPVEFVGFLFDLNQGRLDDGPVIKWSIVERVDQCIFVHHICFKISGLEACVEVRLRAFLGENRKAHQPLKGVCEFVLVVVG